MQFAGVRLDLDIVSALLRAKRGRAAEATDALDRCIAEATNLGLARETFEARLVQASLVQNARRADEMMRAIEEDARQKGFAFRPERLMVGRANRPAPVP